jgi:hypothetical protein
MPKNPSPKQQEASRRNGARSQGPQSPEGLFMAALGPFKHGKYAKHASVLHEESVPEYVVYRDALVRRFQPVDDAEMTLVTAIATCDWRLDRYFFFESRAIDNETIGHLNTSLLDREQLFFADVPLLAVESLLGRSKLLQFLGQHQSRIIAQRASLQRQLLKLQATRPSALPPLIQFDPYPLDPEAVPPKPENEKLPEPENPPQATETKSETPVIPPSEGPERRPYHYINTFRKPAPEVPDANPAM